MWSDPHQRLHGGKGAAAALVCLCTQKEMCGKRHPGHSHQKNGTRETAGSRRSPCLSRLYVTLVPAAASWSSIGAHTTTFLLSLGSVFISPQNETETPHPAIQSCQELEPSASLLPFTRIEYGQLLLLTHPPCLQCPQPSLSLKPEILFVLQNLAKGLKLLRLF